MAYTYRLGVSQKTKSTTVYSEEELQPLTTLQLREICQREKLVLGLDDLRDRQALIKIILRFRGAENYMLIEKVNPQGFEYISKLLDKLDLDEAQPGKINIPAHITLYRDVAVDERDQYFVETGGLIGQSNVLLVDEQKNICAVLTLKTDGKNNYYLSMSSGMLINKAATQNYYLLFFKQRSSQYLYNIYYQKKTLPVKLVFCKAPIAKLMIEERSATTTMLAIDFGTSNTTAGAYLDANYVPNPCQNNIQKGQIKLNQINFVKFPQPENSTPNFNCRGEMLPTVVAVVSCSDPEKIKYLFGHEAIHYLKKQNYNPRASLFYELKRWVNHPEQIQEVMDEEGNIAYLKSKDIIKAFLEYIIEQAEHQFKCIFTQIHVTSPVRLKEQFLEMFKNILPERLCLEQKHALDEGVAVLYNTIANQIEQENFREGEEYNALILDCGGGTTDLSTCSFQIQNGEIAYHVDVHTNYENGDTNFGGKNITYRILQYLKIRFAQYYLKQPPSDIDQLLTVPPLGIYRYVDEHGIDALYQNIQQKYEEMEAVIPTQFYAYQHKNQIKYRQIKSNYYFLWNLAEQLKESFFQKSAILRSTFHTQGIKKDQDDLKINALETWCLAIANPDGELENTYDLPQIIFTINEINTLIQGDIYNMIKSFFENFYWERTLQDYHIIKLTGQSCRIELFKDALKEFVPGRSIEFRHQDQSLLDLKLSCLRGVLRYFNAKKIGLIHARIENLAPVTPYSIIAYTHQGQERVLISSLEKINQTQGFISRHIEASEMEIYLKDAKGTIKYKYIYPSDFSKYEQSTYEKVNKDYTDKVRQDDVDNILDDEIKFFVFAYENRWGFYVLPIARKEGLLYIGERKYFPFENREWDLNYFDGLK